MKRFGNSRMATRLVAAVVGLLTFAVAASAVQTIATPNAAFVSYSLASGASTGAIVPPANQAVLVMGTQTAPGYRGVGQVSMLRVPGSFLEWVGLESTSGAAIAQGFSGSPGTHIVYLDWVHTVDIQVNTTDSFRVHNGNGSVATGNVTMIW
ncbi:MAG TPA: hypothetical protein VFA04_19140 [Bryobacteraceae bacterium]|nr:hypothetical protein [Bryobacteraceae bacterium]